MELPNIKEEIIRQIMTYNPGLNAGLSRGWSGWDVVADKGHWYPEKLEAEGLEELRPGLRDLMIQSKR